MDFLVRLCGCTCSPSVVQRTRWWRLQCLVEATRSFPPHLPLPTRQPPTSGDPTGALASSGVFDAILDVAAAGACAPVGAGRGRAGGHRGDPPRRRADVRLRPVGLGVQPQARGRTAVRPPRGGVDQRCGRHRHVGSQWGGREGVAPPRMLRALRSARQRWRGGCSAPPGRWPRSWRSAMRRSEAATTPSGETRSRALLGGDGGGTAADPGRGGGGRGAARGPSRRVCVAWVCSRCGRLGSDREVAAAWVRSRGAAWEATAPPVAALEEAIVAPFARVKALLLGVQARDVLRRDAEAPDINADVKGFLADLRASSHGGLEEDPP